MNVLSFDYRNIVAVGIRTTAGGPFAEDLFWHFLLRGGSVELPGSRITDLDELGRRFPGLDYRKVSRAMASCEDRVFRVWHHEQSRDRPDEASLGVRFERLVERLGARARAADVFRRLHAAWSSEARRYHDVEHLVECLGEVDQQRASHARDLVELALWYHDAIYDAGAAGCEARSAAWLESDAAVLGIAGSVARSAARLVEATVHGIGAGHPAGRIAGDEAALVNDIDLTILGRDPLRFMEFEYGVEEEFAAVPTLLFRRGRGRFLSQLLDGPIYRSASFRQRFEARARANVAALLGSRRYRAFRWLRWMPR